MEEIVTAATHRDPAHKRPLVAVMDCALGLWKPLALILSAVNWIVILDIIHVMEYLWKVGKIMLSNLE